MLPVSPSTTVSRRLSPASTTRQVGRLLLALAAALCGLGSRSSLAGEAQWIWSPAYEKEAAPTGDCYFRKSFTLATPEHGEIQIAADDRYELYVNGRLVGSGQHWKALDVFDVTKYLVSGLNVVAVKVENTEEGAAGLVARVAVQDQGGTHVSHATDEHWKTSLKEFPQWNKPRFNDNQWLAARAFGELNATLPWGNETSAPNAAGRFRVLPEFHVEWVLDPKDTGSLIAMAFDEFGQILASRENGPLLLMRDDNKDGLLDTVTTLCDKVKNCQGILAISGKVFVIGDGPEGTALYRLADEDHDGSIDSVESMIKFTGEMGEHGPHALALGPDGLIYMVAGNFTRVGRKCETSSPYHDSYEGDLLQPRYEDASGHAVGIKAPGGTILRTDATGNAVELFAGGLQNPYDIAFNRDGELFTADSDMEWDAGMPWYRPTRINHVIPGAEFGWRSGWAKWPEYFYDSLPPLVATGRGSPTGIEVYNHVMFPSRFHNAVFVCDWSRGRILAMRTHNKGGSYEASLETFLEGQPLNVTDCAVGPDGWLYFCTGGRETEGGVYRVVWEGKVPMAAQEQGSGLEGALNQPQLQSAWARQQVATVKRQLGKLWGQRLNSLAIDSGAPAARRIRALDLLQLFGPFPTPQLLIQVSQDASPQLRARAAYLMGIHFDDATQARLQTLLVDRDVHVQRIACESLMRTGLPIAPEKLLKLLGSEDRHLAWSARRALEQLPVDSWRTLVLKSPDPRVFLTGALGLMVMNDSVSVQPVLSRCSRLMQGYMTDTDFVNMLRLMQLTLLRGELKGNDVGELRDQLAKEYPSRDANMNRELVRLLAWMQEPTAAERFVEQLHASIPAVEKMQIAMHAHFLKTGWTLPLKLDMLQFYEESRTMAGGHSFNGYVENVSRDFFADFSDVERQPVLAGGAKWPSSALSVLARLPEHPEPETLHQIRMLDRQVAKVDSEAARKLRIGIVAVLGASRDAESMAYLRELYEAEPERRVTIAMGLAQQPDGENWQLLVRALSIVEGTAAQEVLGRLAQVDQTPQDAEAYRQVIVRGLMLRENGGLDAVALLEKWTGRRLSQPNDSWQTALAAWQGWFVEQFPEQAEPKLPVETERNQWTQQELMSYLSGSHASHADAARGAVLFEKAQCIRCHRFGDRGDSVGPDLTNVSRRFQRKEILESILYPSQVISDQYASRSIVTKNGQTLTGMVAPTGAGKLVVLQANGEKVELGDEDIESNARSKVSAMPEGLLNGLTLEEVADLFAYLARPPAEASRITRRPAEPK